MLVSCGHCKLKFNRHTEPSKYISGKWYHERCATSVLERRELANYICQLFGLKRAGPSNYALIKKWVENKGYTYKGIHNTLKYFYEVKKGDKNKSEERIGIVPFIYEEAQQYFSSQKVKEKRALEKFKKAKEEEKPKDIIVNTTCKQKKKRKPQGEEYDLNDLLK